jgi:hypothetical protein
MALQSDWPLLSEAYDRIDADGIAIAMHIIGHGQVPITALRSDRGYGYDARFPERIEAVLAIAVSTIVSFWDNKIDASFDRETDPTIFGPLCSRVYPQIRFSSVRVRQPELVDTLAAAGTGYAIATPKSQRQRRGAYIPQLKIFIKNLKPETLVSTDHDLAVLFENQVKAKRLALELPGTRYIANRIRGLRPKHLSPR